MSTSLWNWGKIRRSCSFLKTWLFISSTAESLVLFGCFWPAGKITRPLEGIALTEIFLCPVATGRAHVHEDVKLPAVPSSINCRLRAANSPHKPSAEDRNKTQAVSCHGAASQHSRIFTLQDHKLFWFGGDIVQFFLLWLRPSILGKHLATVGCKNQSCEYQGCPSDGTSGFFP